MKSNQTAFYFTSADEVEAAFYSAFEMGDIQLMEAVLAEQGVSCIHPGSLPIIGREGVLDSWAQILANLDEPVFRVERLSHTVADDIAIHLVAEHIAAGHQLDAETSLVLATNVYVRQKNGWRLQRHHTSLSSVLRDEIEENDLAITHQAPNTLQ